MDYKSVRFRACLEIDLELITHSLLFIVLCQYLRLQPSDLDISFFISTFPIPFIHCSGHEILSASSGITAFGSLGGTDYQGCYGPPGCGLFFVVFHWTEIGVLGCSFVELTCDR